jgi:hypothetical protein
MPEDQQRSKYRSLIDALVEGCRDGQGQVLPGWVRHGVWNAYAIDHPDEMPEEHRMNTVLAHLGDGDRAAVARMLELSYESGVHDTLRVLHDYDVPPFDEAYEGAPFQDFMGRLKTDWEWPT